MTHEIPNVVAFARRPIVVGDQIPKRDSVDIHRHVNPATGRVTCAMRLASIDDVNVAVSTARTAYPAWRAVAADRRHDLLLRVAALVERHARDLADLSTLESGCPSVLAHCVAVEAARRFRSVASSKGGHACDPHGVIGAILPWNGPLSAAALLVAPTVASGNSLIILVPHVTPFSVLRLGQLFLDAGFPRGVVNVIAGGPDLGEALARHPGVEGIKLTGGRAIAKAVQRAARETLKPCSVEPGGKTSVLVFADADLQSATRQGLMAATNAGGQCRAIGTRLLVERAVYEPYLKLLRAGAGRLRTGDPVGATHVFGPLISEASLQGLMRLIKNAVERDRARLITGGERLLGNCADGFYLQLTIIADVAAGAEIAQQEVFGPVLTVTPFDTDAEAVALANGTGDGLSAHIHTYNRRRAQLIAGQLRAGRIQVCAPGVQ